MNGLFVYTARFVGWVEVQVGSIFVHGLGLFLVTKQAEMQIVLAKIQVVDPTYAGQVFFFLYGTSHYAN